MISSIVLTENTLPHKIREEWLDHCRDPIFGIKTKTSNLVETVKTAKYKP